MRVSHLKVQVDDWPINNNFRVVFNQMLFDCDKKLSFKAISPASCIFHPIVLLGELGDRSVLALVFAAR